MRRLIPFFGLIALVSLFLMMPEIPSQCRACSSHDPYIPLFGAGYFAALIALSLLFPAFPTKMWARAGLLWAVLLAAVLTYLKWCPLCLIGHACNILIWVIWMTPRPKVAQDFSKNERICVLLFAPVSVVALFSCLNLTFMAYGVRKPTPEYAPEFSLKTIDGHSFAKGDAAIINFVSPDCPYCKEQLKALSAMAEQLGYPIVNVSFSLSSELTEGLSSMEWAEDREGQLSRLFKVAGYPTLFMIGPDGKIKQTVRGFPEQFKSYLIHY